MHTFWIIAKTLGTAALLGLDLLCVIAFAQSDVLGTRGPTLAQIFVLLTVLGCAVGIWFL